MPRPVRYTHSEGAGIRGARLGGMAAKVDFADGEGMRVGRPEQARPPGTPGTGTGEELSLARPLHSTRGHGDAPAGAFAPGSPRVTALGVEGGQVLARTRQGALAVYVFKPLQLAVRCGQGVAFARDWPEPLKPFVYQYTPVRASPGTLSGGEIPLDALGVQARNAGGLRPWDQLTFRGWPLYVYRLDRPDAPPAGVVPDLFVPATLTLTPLPAGPGSHGP